MNTNINNQNSTLTEAVKAIYIANTGITVKEILNQIRNNHNHLSVDYRKVYNTLKRVNKGQNPKTSSLEKTSVIVDLPSQSGN